MKTVDEAYKEYHERLEKDKERLCLDLERVIRSLGMWGVNVVRKRDGAVGRLQVFVSKSSYVDPSIQFFAFTRYQGMPKRYSRMIPTKDTEKYIKDMFEVQKIANRRR